MCRVRLITGLFEWNANVTGAARTGCDGDGVYRYRYTGMVLVDTGMVSIDTLTCIRANVTYYMNIVTLR